jgi:hypothetical protein
MVAGIACELVPYSGPDFIVDQRRMLAGIELTVVRNLTGVDWVREQCVEMSAREGFAAALGAIRGCAAFRHFVARINSRAQSAPRAHCSCEANVFRPTKLEHAIQRGDSNGHLGRLPPFGP